MWTCCCCLRGKVYRTREACLHLKVVLLLGLLLVVELFFILSDVMMVVVLFSSATLHVHLMAGTNCQALGPVHANRRTLSVHVAAHVP